MTDNFEHCLEHVLKSEGGYIHHVSDPGGRTNLGVTQRVWEAYVGKKVGEIEMRNLTPDMVKPLYRAQYWNRVKGDELPAGLDLSVFDCAVNSGVYRAVIFLQRIIKAKEDGVIGNQTLFMVKNNDPEELIRKYAERRRFFVRGLYTYATFGKGWEARITRAEADSLALRGEVSL